LKNQKKYYEGRIVNLKNEKIKMEKEIDRIIRERAKAMKGKVDIITAKKYIGTLVKPVKGLIKIYFGQSTVGDVKSTGIEINSPIGSLVNASANGEVIYAGKFGNLGKMVMIDHGYSLITIYGNLISTNVKVGQQVDKNDKIGILGLSKDGDSNLYFETRFNLKSENPNIFF
jgi:septal ring factor EnvC (AmiA/AmiB activator)